MNLNTYLDCNTAPFALFVPIPTAKLYGIDGGGGGVAAVADGGGELSELSPLIWLN